MLLGCGGSIYFVIANPVELEELAELAWYSATATPLHQMDEKVLLGDYISNHVK